MPPYPFRFELLPLDRIQQDPYAPREDLGTAQEQAYLMASLRELGQQQLIAVHKIGRDWYQIIDGVRRSVCAKKLGWTSIACAVHESLDAGTYERLRFEIQNNFLPLGPQERARARARIEQAGGFSWRNAGRSEND